MKFHLLLTAACLALFLQACNHPPNKKQILVPAPKPKPDTTAAIAKPAVVVNHDAISIAAVGDMMLGTSYPNDYTLPPDSAKNSFTVIADELRNADVTFGNLEGSLLDGGNPAHYKLHQRSKAYLFRMPTAYAGVFKDAGFNLLSLANNHIGDFGDTGRMSTTRVLDSIGINYGGLLSHPSTVFERNGIKYGFCAFAPNANTLPILNLPNATRIISELKQRCDIVIVSFHGGGEGVDYEHVPFAMESFISEKRGDVHAFAHNAIDAGADIILGNGPHVSRAMEVYKNRLIAYSLGNFCTYKSVGVSGVCGLAPLLKVNLNKKGEFLNGRIISLRQAHDKGLGLDSLNRAAVRIKQLTEADFPDAGLIISDTGEISLNPVIQSENL
ncbi:CapA family protein [Mucilaginibacter rubeus]|uniref:CapA family protein n=1 Tax=Mucilaginibacter rubeus TaxID=2027860 RepID=A0A5C1IAN7_9SPHI|nr:CapA family protein [Mucilaginibacter rubeus]QEM13791.1 CapA family protein [Mucilaginibacter rubeus]